MGNPLAIPALRGATCGHPRVHEPLLACAKLWRERGGVPVVWEQPPDAAEPLADLARRYDLLVIGHPQIGESVLQGCLLPLNRPDRTQDLVRLAGQSVGASFTSYRLGGDQWALPVDAAAQVQAWRPDRLAGPVATWDDLLVLARHRRVLLPLRPPHSLLAFYTLAANLGQPCGATGEAELNDPAFGAELLDRLRALTALVDPACFQMDPAAVFERMATAEAAEHCAPYAFGDVRYARPGFRPALLAFADIPVAGKQGPVGATLGGAGIAVSAFTARPEAALAFAYWVAGGDAQRGPYADAGGQPGNSAAWNDAAVNAAAGGFHAAIRETLEGAVVRPRHDGTMAFQHAAAERINAGLLGRESGAVVMADVNGLFTASFG